MCLVMIESGEVCTWNKQNVIQIQLFGGEILVSGVFHTLNKAVGCMGIVFPLSSHFAE